MSVKITGLAVGLRQDIINVIHIAREVKPRGDCREMLRL